MSLKAKQNWWEEQNSFFPQQKLPQRANDTNLSVEKNMSSLSANDHICIKHG